jgi:dTDP-4-amino-4,6-dideoxygalactose transaminase
VTAAAIPFANPGAGYRAHQAKLDEALRRVLEGGWYILGREVEAFEQEFAAYLGLAHALGVANGTDALQLALRACGVGPGDGVVTVSHTAVATVAAIEMTGATPVLVDIDPHTYTLDANALEDTLRLYAGRLRVKAVVPVHLYGHPADMPAIIDVAGRHGLYVIEDCAQSHGAALEGRKTGLWGHLAAFSFYPTKNLGAFGDGGAVATADRALADKVRLLREYGWKERYVSACAGVNSRLDEVQAAVLRVRLPHLDADNARRRELAALYGAALQGTSCTLPASRPAADHVYHLYVIRQPDRDRLRAYLTAQGVGTAIHYPLPVHQQPAYLGRVLLGSGGLSVTAALCREIVSLPIYPQLPDDHARRVAELVKAYCVRDRAGSAQAA